MRERRRRKSPPLDRGRIGLAAVACTALAVVAVPVWIALGPPEAADAEIAEPPRIVVPVASHESLVPEAARSVVDRAVNRCRREPSPEAFAALGRIYHGNALTRLAAACYEIAIDLGAEEAQTPYFLGLILFEEGRIENAVAQFRAAIDVDPSYPLAHHHLGRSLLQIGNVKAAAIALERAVELDPSDPVLHTGYAKALRQAGRLDEAEDALREALRLDDAHSAAHQMLGLILHATERPDEAERHLARLRRYNATVYNDPWLWEAYRHAASVEVRVDWARNLLRFGRVESAISLLDDLSRLHSNHHAIFIALADAHLQAGDHQRAVNAFARAAELDPTDAQARLSMAQILLAYNLLSEAEEKAKSALEIDPDLAEAIAVRGAVALRQGRLAEAREKLERAHGAKPEYLQSAALLGETLIEMGLYEEAVEALSRVLPAPAASGAAYAEFQLATALAKLGRNDEAKQALARAAEIEPDNEHIRAKLAALEETPSP